MELPPQNLPPQVVPPQNLPIEARWCLDQRPSLCVSLEVADTAREQQLGLMQRPALPPLRGMWFPVTPSQPLRFWMHNTLAPLDMVFVRDGRCWTSRRRCRSAQGCHARRIGRMPIRTAVLISSMV